MDSATDSETYVEIDSTNNTGFLFEINYPYINLNEIICSLHGGGSLQEIRLLERKQIMLSYGIEIRLSFLQICIASGITPTFTQIKYNLRKQKQ